MKKLNIVIDVDITLVDSATPWMVWLTQNSTSFDSNRYDCDKLHQSISYNLSKYYTMNEGVDGMDFWKQSDLYDELQCYDEALSAVKHLYERGHTITFASFCFPEHEASKIEMLKWEFGFIKPEDFHFVSTKSKGRLKADIIIDDRNMFINQFGDDTIKILLESPYTQCEGRSGDTWKVRGWGEVRDVIRFNSYIL